jgi:type III secretion protein D
MERRNRVGTEQGEEMIKHIRILTGRHRGASLELAAGTWRIGCDDDAAVHISDWQHAPIDLTIGADGRISWCAGDGAAVDVADHETLQFGDVALSVGGPETEAAAAVPAPAAQVRRGPRRRWLALGAVAVPATLLSTALLAMQPASPAAGAARGAHPDIPALLARMGQGALHVGERNGLTVVQGVVRTSADADAVRDLLRRVAPGHAVAHLAVVNDVLASIGESLREPTLKAAYEGNGNFIVRGTTRDGAAVQRRLAQLAADLGPAVGKLDADVTEVRPGWSVADSDSALDAGGLRYVQSLDGSKHFPGASMAAPN